MISHVRGLRYRGGTTNVAEALRVARTQMFTEANGDRPGNVKLIIIIPTFLTNHSDDSTVEFLPQKM